MTFTIHLLSPMLGFTIGRGRYLTGFRLARGLFWLRAPLIGEVQWLRCGVGWTHDKWADIKDRPTNMAELDWLA